MSGADEECLPSNTSNCSENLFWVISVSPENTAVLHSALDTPQPEEASTPQTGKCIIPELWVGERVCESSLLSALV